jgi:hypothetical protein
MNSEALALGCLIGFSIISFLNIVSLRIDINEIKEQLKEK